MISDRQALVGMETVVLIAIGAFAGANGRYLFGLLIESSLLSTAVVNVAGSFVLGALTREAQSVGVLSQGSHRILGTGFLSSFTTYSTFVLDAITATPAVGALYVLGSYGLGFAGAALGYQTVSGLATRDAIGGEH